MSGETVPVIDISPLRSRVPSPGARRVANDIARACREHGFFYITGHGVDASLLARLERSSRAFFALDAREKLQIEMAGGGRAWRGYFPVGAELTSGRPDHKEGLYLGAELGDDDPRVVAGWPLHGRNLFPSQIPALRDAVLEYLRVMTALGHRLVAGVALSLGLEATYFAARYTADPLVLLRLFNYPPVVDERGGEIAWSVGEHTDYGLLTILLQDDAGGLQIRSRASSWIEAPPLPGALVCNIGDMLERVTGGLYRSTPHRVRNTSGRDRLSIPFFFDPALDARVTPIPGARRGVSDRAQAGAERRWDGEDVHLFGGTYGDYLLRKVSRVFPQLRRDVL